MKAIALLILIILILILGPLLTIWALNTLFPALNIEVTWRTWLAVILLGAAFRGGKK